MSSMSQLSQALSQFSLDLLREVKGPSTNVFLSPASISIALAMTYAGSDGGTKSQFEEMFFTRLSETLIHGGFEEMVKALNQQTDAYKLSTANRLYCQKDFQVLKEFLDTLTNQYQSIVQSVDFGGDTENVRVEINQWVEQVTNAKIKDLIAPGILDGLTRLVLVNAIYFKGDWMHKFQESDTSKQPFYPSLNKEVKVNMMNTEQTFLYGESETVQVLGMPYKEDLAMFVVLSKEKFGLSAVEQTLTGQDLIALMKNTHETKVVVALPKFRLEQSFSLKKALSNLGMGAMFDEKQADFSRITGAKDLYVSAVIHKAFIEVNEEGSEAAAATAVVMSRRCAVPLPMPPKSFVADHPFLFLIVDVKSQNVLFLGRYADPE